MKRIHVKYLFIVSMMICLSYKPILFDISNKISKVVLSVYDFIINDKTSKDYLSPYADFGRGISKKKCFRLLWNSLPLTKINNPLYIHGNKGYTYSHYCNKFITIGRPLGRIGNQMFQVAAVIGTAFMYDRVPLIPKNMLVEYLDLPNKYNAEQLHNSVNCSCKKTAMFYPCQNVLNAKKNVTLQGLFQSWKYFHNAKPIIKDIFRIRQEHISNARQYLEKVMKKGFQHVCIHVRRGDMLKYSTKHYNIPNSSFVLRSMEFYVKKYKKVDFLIVSQDKLWCKENIKNVPISPFTHAGDDMALMLLSDHVIVTAGSYGWWGAWLSGGTTIYYKGFPGKNLSMRYVLPDYYPPDWIGIE